MQARLEVVVRDGRVVRLAAPPPLGARLVPAPPADGLHLVLVGTAASLVAGDRLRVRLDVGPGDRLRVRSVAAQLALACGPGCSTALDVEADVGEGARLDWWPEPLVVAAGARHRSSAALRLGPGAGVRWVDELVLPAPPGRAEVATAVRADLADRALWREGLDTAQPGWSGPAVSGGARYLGTVATLGASAPRRCPPPCLPPPWVALAGPGATARVVAGDPQAGREALARAALGVDGT